MPIPGNAEPGPFPGQQQVQQQQPINFSSAIPIKKRRYPIIRPPSPSPEENEMISGSEDHESKNKQESKLPDEETSSSLIDARDTSSDVSKASALIVTKEAASSNIESGQVNVGVSEPEPQEVKPAVILNPAADLGNKSGTLSKENKSLDLEVPEKCTGFQTANVKQEIVSGKTEAELPTMSVELSLGPKEPPVPALERKKPKDIFVRSVKSDPSLLSLALSDEKMLAPIENNDSTVDDVGSRMCANRSNWDLNTTMDVWEGSMNTNAFAHKLANIAGFGKTNIFHDEKSSLTTDGSVSLSLNKGKNILDVRGPDSARSITQPSQKCRIDDSLGLRLAMPQREHFPLSDNLISTSASPKLGLQQLQLSAKNVNRTVKSEPVDDNLNSKRDCSSVGSSSSSNMGLLKLSSVKTELVNNIHLQPSVVSPDKLAKSSRSMNSEVVQDSTYRKKACKSEDATLPSHPVTTTHRQHQESCATSSSSLVVPLMPQSSCNSKLPTCSEFSPSGDLSTHFGHSFHSKELQDRNDVCGEQIATMVSKPINQDDKQFLRPCNTGNLSLDNQKLARVDEHTVEEPADDDEKINIPAEEMVEEESFESDGQSQGNCAVNNVKMDTEENIVDKEDEDYEEGEVREPLQHSATEEHIADIGPKTEHLVSVGCASQHLQPSDLSSDQDITAFDYDGKEDPVKENHMEKICSDLNKDCISISYKPNSEDNSLQNVSDKVLEVGVNEKISVVSVKLLDVKESPGKEISIDSPINVKCGIGVELENVATDNVVKEICSGEDNSTLSKVEASLNGNDGVKDSGNKSRIINLSRATVATSPCKTRSVPNRLLTPRSGRERYSDLDGEIQPRGNRDEIYSGGSNKFAKDRVHDQPHRNSRPSFMPGKGRISGRFNPSRSEWDSDHHDFASETYGLSDYRPVRRKHAQFNSDEIECNGYSLQQDGSPLGSNNRRKPMNDDFPSLRRTSLRRLSPGDTREGPPNRGMQMLRRFPRNMSPNRCNVEAGSDEMGLRHSDKFMRHLSDEIINPVYNNHPQGKYDELDGQPIRGNRSFNTTQRKGYNPRIRSKSPIRSRTRSPGPWSSPQHRSPVLYRMGRMRSPERACFRDEMVSRRRGSPSYMDSGREHVHSNRRTSPSRVFPRSGRRSDALDSREMGDGDNEYMNGPLHSNKFHGDGSMDERRKFVDRRGPLRSFRPNYGNDGENFRFHLNDGPRPYRFCPDGETEFVERGNMREREFDGRMKHHQPLVVSRRNRNIDEQEDGNYRPVERVWHDDGFGDGRGKRRRF